MQWFLPLLYDVIVERIQQKPWPEICRNGGLLALQSGVSSYIKAHLELETIPALPALCPTQDEIAAICPRGRALPAVAFGALPKAKSAAGAARACAGTRTTSTCSATGSFSTSWSVRAPVLHETPEEEIGSRRTRHNASSRVSIC